MNDHALPDRLRLVGMSQTPYYIDDGPEAHVRADYDKPLAYPCRSCGFKECRLTLRECERAMARVRRSEGDGRVPVSEPVHATPSGMYTNFR